MATAFPTALDTLTNPSATDKLNAGSGHADQHADANDAIEALQAKVGIDNSAVATSLDYRVNALEDEGASSSFGTDSATNASLTTSNVVYHRIGNTVSFGGSATIAAAGAGSWEINLTLPVDPNAGLGTADGGVAVSLREAGVSSIVYGKFSFSSLNLSGTASGAGSVYVQLAGTYEVTP